MVARKEFSARRHSFLGENLKIHLGRLKFDLPAILIECDFSNSVLSVGTPGAWAEYSAKRNTRVAYLGWEDRLELRHSE